MSPLTCVSLRLRLRLCLLPVLLGSAAAFAGAPSLLLRGRVVGPDGAAVPSAAVYVSTDFWDPDNRAVVERFPGRTYDAALDGSFVVPSAGPLRPGVRLVRLRAVASAIGFSTSDEVVSAPLGSRDHAPPVLRLRPGIALTIVVIDAATQAPIGNARVTPPRWGDPVTVGADGTARFSGRDDRSNDHFMIEAPGYAPTGVPTTAGLTQRVALRRPAPPVEVRPRPSHGVAGRVVDPRGRPLAGVTVTVRPVDELALARPAALATTKSDGDGRFAFAAVPLDRCVIAVEEPRFASKAAVVDAQTATVEIVATRR